MYDVEWPDETQSIAHAPFSFKYTSRQRLACFASSYCRDTVAVVEEVLR